MYLARPRGRKCHARTTRGAPAAIAATCEIRSSVPERNSRGNRTNGYQAMRGSNRPRSASRSSPVATSLQAMGVDARRRTRGSRRSFKLASFAAVRTLRAMRPRLPRTLPLVERPGLFASSCFGITMNSPVGSHFLRRWSCSTSGTILPPQASRAMPIGPLYVTLLLEKHLSALRAKRLARCVRRRDVWSRRELRAVRIYLCEECEARPHCAIE